MARDNGGVIGVLNTPTSTTASGVWALQDQYEAKRNGNWPLTPFVSPYSARFNSGSSDYLNRTAGSSPSNNKIWTFSSWVKRSSFGYISGLYNDLINSHTDANNRCQISFHQTTDDIFIYEVQSSTQILYIRTNRVFRDPSAWYHILVNYDSTQATSTNRVKIYVNGSQETSLSQTSYPSQNTVSEMNKASAPMKIGSYGSGNYYNGYMSDTYFIDGQQLDPSSFGASNASGVWYPIPYTGSYGTNGFNLKFTNASSLGTDSSPNGNNWTVNNLTSVDQSTDSTLNNFNIMNPLDFGYNATANASFSEGNLKITGNTTAWRHAHGNIGVSKGKWYYEGKVIGVPDGDTGSYIGWCDPALETTYNPGNNNASYNFYAWTNGTIKSNTSSTGSYYTFTENDICGFALDLDNGKGYISKNGTFYNNGNTSSTPNTSSPDFTITISSSGSGVLVPCIIGYNDGGFFCNFGSPPYAANSYADGAGYGNFSYAVPSGYYALCTANLNTYG